MNHLAKGRFHSRTVSNGLNHVTYFFACSAQNASGSAAAASYRLRSLTLALARNSGLGANVRRSSSRVSIVLALSLIATSWTVWRN
jgi:hypothetical protein